MMGSSVISSSPSNVPRMVHVIPLQQWLMDPMSATSLAGSVVSIFGTVIEMTKSLHKLRRS